ncbi:MAG: MFS transporter [Lachnospiraceae bacterium]|nr:MFS transporter [Acetatifactor muris]MCM1218594.1 MFS transporter [Lachnospiraceae bacterium]
MKTIRMPLFNSKGLNSRVNSANVQNSERWIGFFLGPGGVILLNAIMASYLNVYWTDVAKISGLWGGAFVLVFPIVSKIIDAFTNIIMGQIIDNTKTKQGRARPWLLVGAPIIVIAAILSFSIPKANPTVQAVWIMFSYNLYYSIGYTIYYMSHNMLVPLSTRNAKQRDGVAMLSNMALSIIPGMFVAMLFPALVLPALGVEPAKWRMLAIIFSLVALPCAFLEYYFTKERISEETSEEEKVQGVSIGAQLKACLADKYWVIFMIAWIIIQLVTNIQNTSLIYYCNWVLGTYNDGVTQTIVSAIGNAPLGFGILIMWPLVGKFGKRNVMVVGLALAVVAGFAFCINPTSMGWVLGMLMIRAFGALPITYIVMAMLADALDHVEWKAGFRCDGFSMSVYTIIFTVTAGIAQGVFNFCLNAVGYVPPAADGSWVSQSAAVQNFFVFGYQGLYAIGMIVVLLLFWFWKLDKELPGIQKEIIERHKAAAAAEGRVWISPDEQAAMEQAEQEKLAEAKRIEELKAKCARKNLNFDEEEARYQAKLAADKAKAEAKAARKKKS